MSVSCRVRKRNGEVCTFDREKIEDAVNRACLEVRRTEDRIPVKIAEAVEGMLEEEENEVVDIEDIQAIVTHALITSGNPDIAAAYREYAEVRRAIRVAQKADRSNSVTDSILLLDDSAAEKTDGWDREKLVYWILSRQDISGAQAEKIAKKVESIVVKTGLHKITFEFIKKLCSMVALERNIPWKETRTGLDITYSEIEKLFDSKSEENSNVIANNPEAINMYLTERVFKDWALHRLFPDHVSRAHIEGAVHLHDLGTPHIVYCSAHSVEYVKKFGLRGLVNLNTESVPARSASVLTGHLNTFLASMRSYYAGAIGLGFLNIMYSPYLVGKTEKELYQIAQELIFNGSQNAFSRGAQTLFLDFNVHSSVPEHLRIVPAVHPGGRYMARNTETGENVVLEERYGEKDKAGHSAMSLHVPEGGCVYSEYVKKGSIHAEYPELEGYKLLTYADYEKETRDFATAIIRVSAKGDANGKVFSFPKIDFHVDERTFRDPEAYAVYKEACKLAAVNGATYFIFDRDAVTLSACCRLRTTVQDQYMLLHPEALNFCGFQNVTINIPQAAYRAKRSGEADVYAAFMDEIRRTMDIAVEAHLAKKKFIQELINAGEGSSLHQLGKDTPLGTPYVNLEAATYIIGLIGMNDALRYLYGKEMHESSDVYRKAMETCADMFLYSRELSEKYGIKFALEESPAESASRRLARMDLKMYPESRNIVRGSVGNEFYTNSIHYTAEAPVDVIQRVQGQACFHPMIESGAITHMFVGEESPSAEVIEYVMKRTFYETQSAQVCISPEFTECAECGHFSRGIFDSCPACHSMNVTGVTRVVGYFSKVRDWNDSKREERKRRHAGNYSLASEKTHASEDIRQGELPEVCAVEEEDCGSCRGL